MPIISAIWLLAVAGGMGLLAEYGARAGDAGNPAGHWIGDSGKSDRPRLIMFLHPRCPCSSASVEELARLMTRCSGRLAATVAVYTPEGETAWLDSHLTQTVRQIPDVNVVSDVAGEAAESFGVETSGHVLVYDTDNYLTFSGGITASRGHLGDNAGRTRIVELAGQAGGSSPDAAEPFICSVFGCPLFSRDQSEGSN